MCVDVQIEWKAHCKTGKNNQLCHKNVKKKFSWRWLFLGFNYLIICFLLTFLNVISKQAFRWSRLWQAWQYTVHSLPKIVTFIIFCTIWLVICLHYLAQKLGPYIYINSLDRFDFVRVTIFGTHGMNIKEGGVGSHFSQSRLIQLRLPSNNPYISQE